MTATMPNPTASPSIRPVAVGIEPVSQRDPPPCSNVLPVGDDPIKPPLCAAFLATFFRKGISADLARRQPFARARPLQAFQRIARVVLDRRDQRGVDVGLAAHRHRIAERLGNRLDHRVDAEPGVLGLVEHLLERQHRRAPGAEMLGREIAASRLADIVIHVVGRDVMGIGVAVHILEQRLAGSSWSWRTTRRSVRSVIVTSC